MAADTDDIEERRESELAAWMPTLLGFMAIVIFLLTCMAMYVAGADATDFAANLEAIATTGALLAASVAVFYTRRAARYAYRAFELESRREQDRVDAIERAQAALVAAWPVRPLITSKTDLGGESERTWLYAVEVQVHNASPMPVSDLHLGFVIKISRGKELVQQPLAQFSLPWLQPTDAPVSHIVNLAQRTELTEFGNVKELKIDARLVTSFTDLAGIAWVRTPKNKLSRQDAPDWNAGIWD